MLLSDAESAVIAAEAARRTAQLALIGTGITALISIIAALITQRSNKRIKRIEIDGNKTLAKLNASLSKRKSEEDARRDYDYEARKRLYKECEPLLFRLSEASENALHRIFSLARTARMGDLGPVRPSWLQSPGYYMASTIYNLLAPAVTFRLLQNRLTLVDLTVDKRISNQYLLAKWLYLSFTEEFVLAEVEPALKYKPFIDDWEETREAMPEKHWRQGLALGRLDVAVDGMIKQLQDSPDRCMSFGEFEAAFYKDLKRADSKFGALADIFLYFHPARRPILWRMLVVQAHLNAQLMNTFAQHGATGFVTTVPSDFAGADLGKLDWRHPDEQQSEAAILQPVFAAKKYLETRLPTLFRQPSAPRTSKVITWHRRLMS